MEDVLAVTNGPQRFPALCLGWEVAPECSVLKACLPPRGVHDIMALSIVFDKQPLSTPVSCGGLS